METSATASDRQQVERPRTRPRVDLGSALSVALLVAILSIWQYLTRAGHVAQFILPAPSDVALRVAADLVTADTWSNAAYTLTAILGGFVIATIGGIALGALIAMVPLIDRIVTPYVVALQTIPKVAVAPLLVIWFGFGIESKIVIVALISFFPVLVNAVAGFRGTDPRQLLLMKAIDATAWQVFTKVRVPNALPFLMAGMYIAMIFSVIGAVVGEFIGSPRGLGALILQRQSSMDVIGVFSVLVILSAIGIALNLGMKWLSRRVAFWSSEGGPAGI
jgi:NitT/TauT family transport system permease protein